MSKRSPKTQTGVVLFIFVKKCLAKATNSCTAIRPLTLEASQLTGSHFLISMFRFCRFCSTCNTVAAICLFLFCN